MRQGSPLMSKIKFVWSCSVKNSKKLNIGCMKKVTRMPKINFLISSSPGPANPLALLTEKAMLVILMNQDHISNHKLQ